MEEATGSRVAGEAVCDLTFNEWRALPSICVMIARGLVRERVIKL